MIQDTSRPLGYSSRNPGDVMTPEVEHTQSEQEYLLELDIQQLSPLYLHSSLQ